MRTERKDTGQKAGKKDWSQNRLKTEKGGSQTGGSKDILKSGQVEGRTGGSQGMERQDRRRETGQKQDREQDRKDIR